MTDIVERLLAPGHGALADEAAHEIVLLRDVIRTLLNADDHWLRGNKDNEWASMMATAREKAHAALGETGSD
jgi:hypothetical protein